MYMYTYLYLYLYLHVHGYLYVYVYVYMYSNEYVRTVSLFPSPNPTNSPKQIFWETPPQLGDLRASLTEFVESKAGKRRLVSVIKRLAVKTDDFSTSNMGKQTGGQHKCG